MTPRTHDYSEILGSHPLNSKIMVFYAVRPRRLTDGYEGAGGKELALCLHEQGRKLSRAEICVT
jgi:hypothetical protein